jgi:alkanesulfonate monooxygenase SsuD/methylene tetrahydromethanopterin reductase-like flavin-dependent oxidoreductase (luciferase family)
MGRGFGVSAAVNHDVVREVAREVERLGFSSFWANDMPHADGLATLAAASDSTSQIRLGVGVIPLDARDPAGIAQQVRNHRLPIDRLVLGVGGGDSRDALARVRSGVDVLAREVGAPIVVGALGPKMSALAGEVAGGALFNWLTPDFAERSGRWVLDAVEPGRPSRPSLMAYVRCGLSPGAEPRLREELGRYAGVPQFERHLARMGAGIEETCVLAPDGATLQAGIARYEAVLDEAIVRAVTPDDGLGCLLALMRACAPGSPD